MDDGNRVDEQVRLAVEALPHAPVRWDRIARKARRRKLIIVAALVLASVGLSLVVATGFIAGKSALDPSYTPPLVSKSGLSADFDEPAFGHGLTRLSKYRAAFPSVEGRAREIARNLGYVFAVSLQGNVSEDARLIPRWRIRRRGTPDALPLMTLPSPGGTDGRGKNAKETYTTWIEEPARSGQFVVDFSLMSPTGAVVSNTSSPFHVVTKGLLIPYRAPTYSAGVPRGWRPISSYAHESSHRFVTRLEGPNGMSIVIDTTLGESGGPAASARYLDKRFQAVEEGYRRLSFARRTLGGPAFEWSFEVPDHVSTDIFFNRGRDGYAVLAESPTDRFREARLVARTIVRSLEDKG
jgi:hypothetical protein